MASNYHINDYTVENEVYDFPKPVGNLNIFVDADVTFEISLDGGDNFLTVPPGFVTMPVSPIKSIVVTADGAFSLVGVQT